LTGKRVFLKDVLSQTTLRAWELAVSRLAYTDAVRAEKSCDCLFEDGALKWFTGKYCACVLFVFLGTEMFVQYQLDLIGPDVIKCKNGSSREFEMSAETESLNASLAVTALRGENEHPAVLSVVDLWFYTAVEPVRELLEKVMLVNL